VPPGIERSHSRHRIRALDLSGECEASAARSQVPHRRRTAERKLFLRSAPGPKQNRYGFDM